MSKQILKSKQGRAVVISALLSLAIVLTGMGVVIGLRVILSDSIEGSGELLLTATGERRKQSFGSEARIMSIVIDGEAQDLAAIAARSEGWGMEGPMLCAYHVERPVTVRLQLQNVKSIEIKLIGQMGSGILEIRQGTYHETIDLYRDSDWIPILWSPEISGTYAWGSHMDEAIGVWLLLWMATLSVQSLLAADKKIRIGILCTYAILLWYVADSVVSGAGESLLAALREKDLLFHTVLLLMGMNAAVWTLEYAPGTDGKWSLKLMTLVRLAVWSLLTVTGVEFVSNSTGIYHLTRPARLITLLLLPTLCALARSLARNLFLSGCIVSGIVFIGTIANYYTMQFRGTVIAPTDVMAIGTALNVAGNYEFRVSVKLVIMAVYLVWACVMLYPLRKKQDRPVRYEVRTRVICFALGAAMLLAVNMADVQKSLDISVDTWKRTLQCEKEGLTLTFFDSISRSFLQKPEGYSKERKEELLEAYQADTVHAGTTLPNIIVVMNESFADLEEFDGFSASEPLQPFLHSLRGRENTLYGCVQIPVFGGGTSCTEFEFLTGVNNGSIPISTPYDTMVTKPINALPETMVSLGYRSIAFHPEAARNWSRNKGFPRLGFEEFIDIQQTRNKERVRNFISDESFYEDIKMIDQEITDPLFLFGITMQNHGGYEEPGFEEPIKITEPRGVYPETAQYINLVHESDRAFEKFISYYETEKEPTVIVFFGDHFPGIENELLDTITGPYATGTAADNLLKYHTPFYIWANYDLDKAKLPDDGSLISVSLLQSVMMDAAGLPKTGYQKFLSDVAQKYPVISANCVLDKNGDIVAGSDKMLTDYACLQYALLKDDDLEEVFLFAEE